MWVQTFRCYQLLKTVDDMNDSWSWATQGFGWHEWWKVMSSGLWMLWITHGSRFYEQIRVMDHMNDLGSREFKPLDAMNSSGLWKTWTTPGREIMALDAMNHYRLWMTWTNQARKIKALDVRNSSRLWMTWTTLDRELKALDAMNSSKLWMMWTTHDPVSSSI